MKLKEIIKELNALAKTEGLHRATLGGCEYRIQGSLIFDRVFKEVKPEITRGNIKADNMKKAMKLYGTEFNAVKVINDQIERLGDDLDEGVLKRAKKLVESLTKPLYISKNYKQIRVWEKRKLVYQNTDTVLSYFYCGHQLRQVRDFLGINNREYKGVTLDESQLDKLKEAFFVCVL